MKKITSYHLGADVIRVISVICVVIIHTANAVYARPDYFGGLSWWIAMVLGSFARVAIPLFIMLSGYLLLAKNESLEKSLKRVFSRIVIPLLFWASFYIWWGNGMPSVGNINTSIFQKFFIINVGHLYFLYIVLGLYIAAPFIRSYLSSISEQSQKYLIMFLLTVGMIQVLAQYLFVRCGSSDAFTFWIPYTGFFVAGYLLPKLGISRKRSVWMGIYVVGLLATIGFDYYFYLSAASGVNFFNPAGCISYYFDYYLSINVVMMSVGLFMLLMQINYSFIKDGFLKKSIYSIARASFGIFILHIFFLSIIDGRFPQVAHLTPLWVGLLLRISIIFALSYLVTMILTKIPYVKMLFGEK